MNNSTSPKINILTILAGALLAGILIGLVFLLIYLSGQDNTPQEEIVVPTAVLTIIPAPTPTSVLALPIQALEPTPTTQAVLPPGVIGMGAYVQVSGTDGSGLNMRNEPGTSSAIQFVAMDEEVFLVIGGPVEANEYLWWQLEAPYDQTRTGWAADTYLGLIEQSTGD